jgi:hypothetical protein
METFDKREWRKQGGMTPQGHYIPTTSTGRQLVATAHRTPKKGEWFLKPSGQKGIFNVLQAQEDHAKYSYTIMKEVKGQSEYRAIAEEQRRHFLRITGH